MVAAGDLGDIRVVQVECAQDWLADDLETTGQKQAGWRSDPAQTGAGGSTGDIGTHAFNLASFVTRLELDSLAADLQSFVPGRRVDDNGHVMLRFKGGARGMLWCSQVAAGCEIALRLRVFGTKAGIEWAQEDPNCHWVTPICAPGIGSPGRGLDHAPKRAASAECPQDTLKGIWRHLPTSMSKPLGPSSPGGPARHWTPV
jgi:predicted dehydrogenase